MATWEKERDVFAACALSGLLAAQELSNYDFAVRTAWDISDKMMAERNKRIAVVMGEIMPDPDR